MISAKRAFHPGCPFFFTIAAMFHSKGQHFSLFFCYFAKKIFMEKKLRRSYNKMIAGVCAGIAEYFALDPTVVRIAYVLLSIFSVAFPGIILYIILMLIMPQPEPEQ